MSRALFADFWLKLLFGVLTFIYAGISILYLTPKLRTKHTLLLVFNSLAALSGLTYITLLILATIDAIQYLDLNGPSVLLFLSILFVSSSFLTFLAGQHTYKALISRRKNSLKNPCRFLTTPVFLFFVICHLICGGIIFLAGDFLWPVTLFVQALLFAISLIPYFIGIRLFRKVRIHEHNPIWEWTCFGLFVLINCVTLYLNALEIDQPFRWSFG